jgi:diadenosine tetraphosphatase ApaH/serine/threonine PP2A family protein phosphatase
MADWESESDEGGEPVIASAAILRAFQDVWEGYDFSQSPPPNAFAFPILTPALISSLLDEAFPLLSTSKAIISVSSPVVIVGDLHGSMLDLLRVFQAFSDPPKSKFLFLGDYVDRGLYSIPVICVLLAYLVQYPTHIYVLRGNHEFSHINRVYGFRDDFIRQFGSDDLWNRFQDLFAFFPLAAIVHESIFCVHGGLSPSLNTLKDLEDLEMPIPNYLACPMVSDLVWSDPNDRCQGFRANSRGSGQMFGPDVIETFLKVNGLKLLIRAHQCVMPGYQIFANMMGVTVFSSSNYCNLRPNKCGVVHLKEDNEISFFALDSESDLGSFPRVIHWLPMDGDIGLKRMLRVSSRPELRAPAMEIGADVVEEADTVIPAMGPLRRTRSCSVSITAPD